MSTVNHVIALAVASAVIFTLGYGIADGWHSWRDRRRPARHAGTDTDLQLADPRVNVCRVRDLVNLAVIDGVDEVVALRLSDQQALELANRLTRAVRS